jgi:hypothetical protein
VGWIPLELFGFHGFAGAVGNAFFTKSVAMT